MPDGFDHHLKRYWMLNNNCFYEVLYIYSNADQDGDAGYDAKVELGAWDTTVEVCSNATNDTRLTNRRCASGARRLA